MTTKRQRVNAVRRVRRLQELQSAGEMARASAVVIDAEAALASLRAQYEAHRDLDMLDALVPDRLRDHQTRVLHAESIQRGRDRVREAVASFESRREDLVERTMAVKAMERLEERLAVEEEAESRRLELRELDERNAGRVMTEAGT